jgi:hypothetical protein
MRALLLAAVVGGLMIAATPAYAGGPERKAEARKYLRWYVEGAEDKLRTQEVFRRNYCGPKYCRVLSDQAKADGLRPPRKGPPAKLPEFDLKGSSRKCAPLQCHYTFRIRFHRKPGLGRLKRDEKVQVSVRRNDGELTNAYREVPLRPGQKTGIGPAPWYWAGGLIVAAAALWGVLMGLLWLGTPRRKE